MTIVLTIESSTGLNVLKYYLGDEMAYLKIYFFGDQLIRTEFSTPQSSASKISIRGKTEGAMKGAGTFQWTSAVRALVLLLLGNYLKMHYSNSPYLLVGGRGSSASSLDYAISKQVQWLQDMFGTDLNGNLVVRRLVLRTNSNSRLPGPVILALNQNFLDPKNINIEINGETSSSPVSISQLMQTISNNHGLKACQLDTSHTGVFELNDLHP